MAFVEGEPGEPKEIKERLGPEGPIVVKVGGGEGNNLLGVCEDLASLTKEGYRFVLVHGVSHRFDTLLRKSGHEPDFATSSTGTQIRIVDAKTIKIFTKACNLVSTEVLIELARLGVWSVSLLEMALRARQSIRRIEQDGRSLVLRNNLTGIVESTDPCLLKEIIGANYIPIISPLGQNKKGVILNVDGDQAAAVVASSLGARLIILSNVPGLLRNVDDPSSLIPQISPDQIDWYLNEYAQGRMRVKLGTIGKALGNGVPFAVIGSSRVPRPIRAALLGEQGTIIGNV